MNSADEGSSVKEAVHKGHGIEISSHVKVTLALAQPLLSLPEHRAGVIQENDLVVAVIAVGEATKSGSYLQQTSSTARQEIAQCYAFN